MNRIGDVVKLDQHVSTREDAPKKEDVCVKVVNGSYSWGFKVKKDADKNTAIKDRLDLDEDMTVVLDNLNLDLKYNDTLVVVGKIGNSKTTLLMSLMDETVRISGT